MAGEVCVRVAVRVRPLLPKEILHNHQVCVRVVPDSAQVMLGSDRTFSFDHAFGPTEPQDQIYESCVRPLVASLVEGYNATVFAYGQTGSGKTYTLGGGHVASLPEEEEGGIIRRVAQDLFLLLGERGERGEADVGVRVSYVELYREELRDLLELHTSHKELHIREDDRGNTVVVGARETAVSSAEELLSVVEVGDALRHTGATLMNQRSSRSHAILTLQLGPLRHHHDNHNHAARSSKLHLVDLAGSERAGRTGNTGLRLKESAQINAGLLALGNVIRALSDPRRRRDHHVPYRDAKITRLLRDSLGGHAHTLMVACVSPSHQVIVETLSVLQFAARARHVRNRPEWAGPGPRGGPVGAGPGWDPAEARLGELEQEVQTLREALKERGRGGAGVTDSSKQEVEPERDGSEAEPRYWCLARDAALLLEELPSGVLSGSLSRRLEVWLERHRAVDLSDHSDHCVGEAGDGPHLTMVQLRRELQQCQETLAIDEHVFDQKEAELEEAQREVQTLLQERETHFHALEEEREHRRIQSETLVEQQLLISRLRGDLLTSRTASSGASVEAEASGNPARRPHSVPLISQGHSHEGMRKIHSSPPTCCLERVMAAFRTRSQLLLAQIEERDHVRCPHLTQREERKEGEEEEGGGRKGFRRSMNRTWTNKQNPACSGPTHQTQPQNTAGLDQNHLNGFQLPQLPELPAGSVGGKETEQHKRLKEAGLRAGHTHRRIQDMSINMRLKEELIKELDKTGKEAEAVDRLYNVDQGKAEPKTNQQQKDTAQLRAQVQQGCGKGVLAGLCERSRAELQHSIDHMRQQREELQLSLRQERETRARLQTSTTHLHRTSDPHRTNGTTDLQRNRELRTEDLSVSLNGACEDSEEKQQRLEKRAWLEQEEELVLQRRRGLQELEEELRRREEVLLHREACLKERNQLEMKRLRSSQALSQDLLRVSACLGAVDQELEEGGAGLRGVSVEELRRERESLRQKRDTLDTQLRDGRVLTRQEELALLQLEEAVEAVDAAVEFKNRSIQERRRLLGGSSHTDLSNPAHGDVTRKLRELSLPEASALLVKYFNKVVCLRESERRLQLRCEDLQLQTEEQQGVARDMEAALHRLTLDTDRRLTEQQREHQHSIQLLLQQLREGVSGDSEQAAQAQASEQVAQANEQAAQAQARLQQLERDLFFYKSSSRELKRKLRELVTSSLQPQAPPPTSRPQSQTQGTIQTSRPQTQSQTQGRKEGRKEARHSDGGAEDGLSVQVQRVELAPVRLSRRELRQILPCDLSAPRGQSTLATSRGSWFLEDSIEAPRNTD